MANRLRREAPGIISGRRCKGEAVALEVGAGADADADADDGDWLAQAICDIAAHYGKPQSAVSLTAGLPLVSGRLPLEHAERAAGRASLALSIDRLDILSLGDHDLPAITLSQQGQVEIVWRMQRADDGKPATITMGLPGRHDVAVDLAAAEFAAAPPQQVMRLRPMSGLDERGESAIAQSAKGWFLPAFRESRHIYAQAVAATIAVNLLALAVPLFSMNVYDRVLPNAAETTLWALAIGVMIAISCDFLIRTLRAIFVDTASRRADVRLAGLIYSRLLGARLTGKAVSTGVRANTMREFETLRDFLNSATLTAFGDLPFMVLFLAVIWVVSGPLLFVVAASMPIILGVGWLTQRRLRRLIEASFKEAAQKNAVIVETLVGMEAIKAAGAESWAAANWEKSVAESLRTGFEIRHTSNLGQHVIHAVQTSVQVLVVVFGFYMVAAGDLTMGALIATTILSGRALAPLAQAAGLLGRLNQARIAYTSLSEIVASPQERRDGAGYLSKVDIEGAITFENVSFAYDQAAQPALHEFSLAIAPGEHVAFIGGIGSGKTTALKLIHNFYQPGSGRVLLDGTSVSQIEPALLRGNVGLHLQDSELFHGTIRENIAIADPGASDQAIIEAARISGALDWVAKLSMGFDTPIGERGAGLSGGQRQSVSLARTLLRRPRVLLLDEPTSDMDGRSERSVIARLQAASEGRTLVLVTHRPALLELVDRIIILEGGRIIEDGRKDKVLEQMRALSARQAQAATASQEDRKPNPPAQDLPPAAKRSAAERKVAGAARHER